MKESEEKETVREVVLAEKCEFVGQMSEKLKESEVAISTSGLWSSKCKCGSCGPTDFRWTVGPSLFCHPKQKPYL